MKIESIIFNSVIMKWKKGFWWDILKKKNKIILNGIFKKKKFAKSQKDERK